MAVLSQTTNHPLHAYRVLSLTTGVRTKEARPLQWDRVHLSADVPYVEVWRSVRKLGETKTKSSRRTLALPSLAVEALKKQEQHAPSGRQVMER